MIERVFLGWSRPLLPSAADFLIERVMGQGAADLRGVTVVVPGGRAGRRLKELLLDAAVARGIRLTPPRVVTVGGLPELFYTPERPLAPPVVARRAWSLALRSAPADRLAKVFGDLPAPGDVQRWDGLAGQIESLHRDVSAGALRFGGVAEICGSGELGYDDGERWRVLADVQRRYSKILKGVGYLDRDLARMAASAPAAESEVLLVGVAELPAIAARMVLRSATPVVALVHAPPGEAEQFDAAGCVIPGRWADRQIAIGTEQIVVVDRPAAQAAAVARQVAGAGDGWVGDVVVATADASLVPYLREWLGAVGLPTHYAGGIPMTRTDPVRLLQATADYLDGRDWESFAALIRHPALEGRLRRPTGEGDRLRSVSSVDRYFAAHLPASVRPGLPAPTRGGEVEPAVQRLHAEDLLGPLEKPQRLTEWAARIIAFLGEVYGSSRLDPEDPTARRILDSLESLRRAALALRRLPAPLAEPTPASFALRLLVELVAGDSVPEESEGEAVDLLGWLELALDDAADAVVAGVNEGTLPDSRTADPFLPDTLRSRLGLLDNAGRYARDAFLLTALLESRRRVRLITGRITAEGDPLRPSRLLLAERGPALAERVLAFADARPGDPVVPPLTRGAGSASGFILPLEGTIEFDPPDSLRVTAFAALLDDPYRWALEHMLRLERVDDEAREMDGARFGSLAHTVLRRFSRSEPGASRDLGEITAALDRLLDAEARALFAGRGFPAVRVQVEQLRARLHAFAAHQSAWTAAGWETVLVEGEPLKLKPALDMFAVETVGAARFDVDGVPITLRGRIDRVDRNRKTGAVAILDYKTSDRPRLPDEVHRDQRKQWQDLQLPLYRHILAATRDHRGNPIAKPGAPLHFGYVVLSRELDKTGFAMAGWTEPELEQADEVARRVVRTLRTGGVEFRADAVRTWPGDALAPLLGRRQLVGAGETEDETAEEDAA